MSADLEESVVSVTLPEMGESVTEGSIVEWRRSVGEFVAEGDPLVEVTTDKVDVEVPATASGQLTEILAREGQTVAVGTVLAQIDTSKHDGAAAWPVPRGNGAQTAPPVATAAPAAPVARRGAAADHAAERIARQLDVDLSSVRGSGPDGLILRSDVVEQAGGARRRSETGASSAPPVPAGAKVTQLRGPSAALAGYMEQ
ncbi:MAG: E3 binding domain-containing protein, partial [Candidatus Eremiobacteraeota bacterium]|nr:E3 binding domain-containing protein [Candidatus Eremiobacteraeota bacterium]